MAESKESMHVDSILGRLDQHEIYKTDKVAFIFLSEQNSPEVLTFGQLALRVRTLAAVLREKFGAGDRVILAYPHGVEFVCAFLACLSAELVAIPAYPPRRDRKMSRLLGIIENSAPSVLLTVSSVIPNLPSEILKLPVLATDEWETIDAQSKPSILVQPNKLAFLQYTSGSTGSPKGVMVTHENIAFNEIQIQKGFDHFPSNLSERTPLVVTWLPLFHDMGLIGGLLQPLYVGFSSVLLNPTSFMRKPLRWLDAITEYRATTTGAPNFAFDICARTITAEEKKHLDLSSLKVLFNGAEPVRAETLDRFTDAFKQCGFRKAAFFPCYGLAEATLFVSGGPVGTEPTCLYVDNRTLSSGKLSIVSEDSPGGSLLVASGRPAEGTQVVVVDPIARAPLQDGEIGELWVCSRSVGAGYYNRAEESIEIFDNHLSIHERPFLNTGDLGFMHNDEVYVTGRSKDMIILGGKNIYPQDVESEIENILPFVVANSCAALSFENGGLERLALIIEADREIVRASQHLSDDHQNQSCSTCDRLWEIVDTTCRTILSEIEVAVQRIILVRPGTFMRTSSGKIRRTPTRAAMQSGELDVILAWEASRPGRLSRSYTN